MAKAKDIGKFTLTFGTNNRHCFGLGFEFYTETDAWWDKDIEEILEIPVARVIRFDLLFAFLNITYWIEDAESAPYDFS